MINFIHPAPGSKLTSPFGRRKNPITGREEGHQGCDYAKVGNVPILASADGVVRQYISDSTTYGNVIFIEHNIDGKRMDTTYAHLKSKAVKNGQKVKQGEIIGYMGNTGASTGQHLHFEIHNGPWASGQPNAVDPLLYVDKVKEKPKEVVVVDKKQVVSDWAKADADWAIKNKITDGTRPLDNVTREEVWVMLSRFYKLLNK